MTDLFRTEEMQLVQLFIQSEAAHDAVEELGQEGLIQFNDLNPDINAFQRRFVNEIKRCDEMDRKLRFFTEQVIKAKIPAHEVSAATSVAVGQPEHVALTLDNMQTRFDELERELKEMNTHQEQLLRRYNELVELRHVLEKAAIFFDEKGTKPLILSDPFQEDPKTAVLSVTPGAAPSGPEQEDAETPLLRSSIDAISGNRPRLSSEMFSAGPSAPRTLGFITGTISRAKITSFERVLWRATRGNLYMKQAEIADKIKDPQTEEWIHKSVFIIFFQGERAMQKVQRISEGFGANVYSCPEAPEDRAKLRIEVTQQLDDTKSVIDNTLRHRHTSLATVATQLGAWTDKLRREKAIYHTMNMFNFDVTNKVFLAEGWAPKNLVETIQRVHLRRATDKSGALVPSILRVMETKATHPTYISTNKFTKPFQDMINAYGIARYREINPAIFSTATFPFLFAVMFGDIGHGFFLFLYGLYSVINEKKLAKQMKSGGIMSMFFAGRYVITMMGLFSIFTGFIYNEIFSLPMDIFGTNWRSGDDVNFVPVDTGRTYPFGVDPVWNGANNELSFYNSLKMKMSIIIGVSHMIMGIIFHYFNSKHYRKWEDLYFEFIPQIIFMSGIFGYLSVMIMVKWAIPWTNTNLAPSLLNMMIQMIMNPGQMTPDITVYPGQATVQVILILAAVLSVPIMMFVKPFILRSRNKRLTREAIMRGEPAPEFEFGDIMMQQLIHSVEFLVGTISNTASYLRLWALSLAHSELSKVFLDKIFYTVVGMNNFVVVFGGFAAFAGATFAVMCVMEALSCFLHALRLHWVEHMNKYFHGDGYQWKPTKWDPPVEL